MQKVAEKRTSAFDKRHRRRTAGEKTLAGWRSGERKQPGAESRIEQDLLPWKGDAAGWGFYRSQIWATCSI